MNVPRYVWGSLAIFVYIFLIEWLFHGVLLRDMYGQSLDLLRQQSEAPAYTVWMLLGFLILAFGFCLIFVKGYEGKGIGEGIRFGLYVGITFAVSGSLVNYAVFPLPGTWIVAWVIGYPIIMMLAGVIIAAIYRPKTAAQL